MAHGTWGGGFSMMDFISFFYFSASSRLLMRIKGRGVYGNKQGPSPVRITVIGFEQSFGSRAKGKQGRGEERKGECCY